MRREVVGGGGWGVGVEEGVKGGREGEMEEWSDG